MKVISLRSLGNLLKELLVMILISLISEISNSHKIYWLKMGHCKNISTWFWRRIIEADYCFQCWFSHQQGHWKLEIPENKFCSSFWLIGLNCLNHASHFQEVVNFDCYVPKSSWYLFNGPQRDVWLSIVMLNR